MQETHVAVRISQRTADSGEVSDAVTAAAPSSRIQDAKHEAFK
jgi:hypothetical protein